MILIQQTFPRRLCENSMTTVGAASSRDWALKISNASRGWKPFLRLDVGIAGVLALPPRRRLPGKNDWMVP